MFKERYEKPVVKPTECTDGLLREKYQKPDMELVDLGVIAIVASEPLPSTTVPATSITITPSAGTTTPSVPTVTATAQPAPTSVLVPSK